MQTEKSLVRNSGVGGGGENLILSKRQFRFHLCFLERRFFGEIKVSTSTVAALFSKMALTDQRIVAMVGTVLLVLPDFHVYRRGWMEPEFRSEDFLFLLSGWWRLSCTV